MNLQAHTAGHLNRPDGQSLVINIHTINRTCQHLLELNLSHDLNHFFSPGNLKKKKKKQQEEKNIKQFSTEH